MDFWGWVFVGFAILFPVAAYSYWKVRGKRDFDKWRGNNDDED